MELKENEIIKTIIKIFENEEIEIYSAYRVTKEHYEPIIIIYDKENDSIEIYQMTLNINLSGEHEGIWDTHFHLLSKEEVEDLV